VTVLLAYPSAMNAVFLPPVVAALYSPTLASAVFPSSTTLAVWLLENVFTGPVGAFFETTFDLEGLTYVALWFGIAVPVGWVLGVAVTLADVVRPKREDDESTGEAA